MPPLPVSNTKFKVSFVNVSMVALIIIMPPVSCIKGNLVINFAGGDTNSSWACNTKQLHNNNNAKANFLISRSNCNFFYPCIEYKTPTSIADTYNKYIAAMGVYMVNELGEWFV